MTSNDPSLSSVYDSASAANSPVLCVDLDGTLLSTDVLWESLLLLITQKPWILVALPFWLVRGKACFKRKVAERVKLDPAALPYNEDLLAFLREEKNAGRQIVLATAADHDAAHSIARHLGVFSEVIASDGETNVAGTIKRHVLERRFGCRRFDYIGNSKVDLKIWSAANAALLVRPSRRVLAKARQLHAVQRVFARQDSRLTVLCQALGCRRWAKNLLVFVPLITSHTISGSLLVAALAAFVAFSLCASSMYISEALVGITADRKHPTNCLRPFASGTLPIAHGVVLSAVLMVSAFLLALVMLPVLFTATLLLYIVLAVAHWMVREKLPAAAAVIVAGLYGSRVLGGGTASGVAMPAWLLASSMVLVLVLASAQWCAELNTRAQ